MSRDTDRAARAIAALAWWTIIKQAIAGLLFFAVLASIIWMTAP